jgi:hypothetical protein
MEEKIFVQGMIVKRNENAPEWVTANLSIKVEELIPFLQQHSADGWVNIQLKVSQGGKHYAELDTWKPTQGTAAKTGMAQARETVAQPADSGNFDDSIPFMPYGYREFI